PSLVRAGHLSHAGQTSKSLAVEDSVSITGRRTPRLCVLAWLLVKTVIPGGFTHKGTTVAPPRRRVPQSAGDRRRGLASRRLAALTHSGAGQSSALDSSAWRP